jgi:CRP-like cAMP-binding protein
MTTLTQGHTQRQLLRTPPSASQVTSVRRIDKGYAPSANRTSWRDGASNKGVSEELHTTNLWCRNRMLAGLSPHARQRLAPHLQRVLLHQNDTLHESGDAIEHVYFIEKGMVSLVVAAKDGSQAEAAVVSSEGVVGGACVLGSRSSFHRAMVQIPGKAYRLPVGILKEECERNGALQQSLHGHLYVLTTQASQAALCNRIHTIEERLCRWLLTARDRIQSNELNLTHELIAQTLGVRRTGVTVAMGILQQAGLFQYSRGRIVLCDSAKVENSACECYGVLREQFNMLEGKA